MGTLIAQTREPSSESLAIGVLLLVFVLLLSLATYLIPAIIGALRGVPNLGSLVIVNLFFGWTLLGWVIALAWAFKDVPRRRAAAYENQYPQYAPQYPQQPPMVYPATPTPPQSRPVASQPPIQVQPPPRPSQGPNFDFLK